MRFADLDVVLGVTLVIGWVLFAVLARRRPRRRHVPILAGTGAAAVLFSAQAVVVDAVADPGPLARLDAPALTRLVAVRTPPITTVMTAVSELGGTAGMILLALVAAAALWWRGRRSEAAVVVLADAGAELLVVGFKNLWARPRPPVPLHLVPESDYSLPSGHALVSIVVLGILTALTWRATRSGRRRAAAVAVCAVLVMVIGVSRLYLGVHWFTDVFAGWLLGAAWLALCTGLLSAAASRDGEVSTRPRPPAFPGPASHR